MGSWLNRDDIQVKVELSTAGDLIANSLPVAYPFVAGGTQGAPVGWILKSSGDTGSNITTNTGLDRFSMSMPAGTTANIGIYWRWALNIPVTQGHSYRVAVSVRAMDNYRPGRYGFDLWWAKDGVTQGNVLNSTWDVAPANWTDMSANAGGTGVTPPAGVNQLQIVLAAGSNIETTTQGWGTQFNNLFVVDQDNQPPPPITWLDISCDLKSLTYRYGREKFTNRYDVGAGSLVLDNNLGQYTFHTNHPLNLRPGRLIRANAILTGKGTFPLYFGLIDSLADGYSLDGRAITTMQLVDPSQLAATVDTPQLGNNDFYTWDSYTRVNNLLTVVGYASKAVDSGGWFMQIPQDSGRSIREEIGVTGDSEGGNFYAERDGRVIYHNRGWATSDSHLTQVQANIKATELYESGLPPIDNIPTVPGAPTICPNALNTDWSRARVINHLELAAAGETAKIYDDKTSQRANGVQTYSRLDYVFGAKEDGLYGYRDTRANDLMAGYANPVLRVNSVSFHLNDGTDVSNWVFGLSVFLNWLVRVWYSHPIHGWGYAVVTHIQSVEHRITVHDWEVTCSVDRMESFTEFVMQPSRHGWDQGQWDTNTWDQT